MGNYQVLSSNLQVLLLRRFAEWLGGQYFQELAESGAYNGLLMFGHDHAGHGLSSGRRLF